MKKLHIYHHRYILFFVLCSNFICTTFDFHQENIHIDEQIKQQRKESKDTYQRLKKQLLETLKAHQNDLQLEQEDVDIKSQFRTHAQEEKQDAHQYFLDSHRNKPFLLVTIQTDQNRGMQSKFIETIGVAIAWLGGWVGSGAALTAAEIAAIEAAKIAAAKLAAGAAGTFVIGSVIKSGIDKLSEKNNNSGGSGSGSGSGGNDGSNEDNGKGNKSSQELKRAQELRENVNKLGVIKSLEKTDSVQAHKATEELRISLARADAQDQRNKRIGDFNALKPNVQQALVDAGVCSDSKSSGMVAPPPQLLAQVAAEKASQIVTQPQVVISGKAQASTGVSLESIAAQIPITVKSSFELNTLAAQSSRPTKLPVQEQVSSRPSSVAALTDSPILHPDIAIHAFISERTVTKLASDTDKVVDDDAGIISHISLGSLVPPPEDNDPENDPDDNEKNIEKKEKVVSRETKTPKQKSSSSSPVRCKILTKSESINRVRLRGGKISESDTELRHNVEYWIEQANAEIQKVEDALLAESKKMTRIVDNPELSVCMDLEHAISGKYELILDKSKTFFTVEFKGGHLAGTISKLEQQGLVKIHSSVEFGGGCIEYQVENLFSGQMFAHTEFPPHWNAMKIAQEMKRLTEQAIIEGLLNQEKHVKTVMTEYGFDVKIVTNPKPNGHICEQIEGTINRHVITVRPDKG